MTQAQGTLKEQTQSARETPNARVPVLTFAIPTWNRAGRLKTCIDLIAAQIQSADAIVEIVVSDNGSEDDTPAVLAAARQVYPFLRTSRNEVNLGFDLNLIMVLQESRGDYVWLFSDDDFLAEGALTAVLQIIRGHHPDNISTNYHSCDDDGNLLPHQVEDPWMLTKDVAGADLDRLFSTQGMRISFISRLIFRRALFDFADYEKAAPTVPHWLPVYIVAHTTTGRSGAYLSCFYAVNWRPGHARETPDVFLREMPEVFDRILEKFGALKVTRKYVLRDIRRYFISVKSYMKFKSLNVPMSPLLIPPHYKLLPRIPYGLAMKVLIWRSRRKS